MKGAPRLSIGPPLQDTRWPPTALGPFQRRDQIKDGTPGQKPGKVEW